MFNIQMFGNNDTVSSGRELKLLFEFTDGDTRTVTLQNAKTNLTTNDIESCSTILLSTQAFVGDKTSADFSKISSADIVEYSRRSLDLT